MRRLFPALEAAAKLTPDEKDQKEAEKHAERIHKAVQAAVDAGHDIHVSVAGKTAQVTTKRHKAKAVKRSAG